MASEFGNPCKEYAGSGKGAPGAKGRAGLPAEMMPTNHEFTPPFEKRAKGRHFRKKAPLLAGACAALIMLNAAAFSFKPSPSPTPPVPVPTTESTQPVTPGTVTTEVVETTEPTTPLPTTPPTTTAPEITPGARIFFAGFSAIIKGVVRFINPDLIGSVDFTIAERVRNKEMARWSISPEEISNDLYYLPEDIALDVGYKLMEDTGKSEVELEMRANIFYDAHGVTRHQEIIQPLIEQKYWGFYHSGRLKTAFKVFVSTDDFIYPEFVINQPDKVRDGVTSLRVEINGKPVDPATISRGTQQATLQMQDTATGKIFNKEVTLVYFIIDFPPGVKADNNQDLVIYATQWLVGYETTAEFAHHIPLFFPKR